MSREVSISGMKIAIGMPTSGSMPVETVSALCKTLQVCITGGVGCDLLMVRGPYIDGNRDMVMSRFLTETDAEWLFWIDHDIIWEPEQFLRFAALAQRYDVVAATYRFKSDESETNFMLFGFDESVEMTPEGLIPVKGSGLGFCIMSRKAIAEVCAQAPEVYETGPDRHYRKVFSTRTVKDGVVYTEDMQFFGQMRDLGYTVYLDPTIELGHIGSKVYWGIPSAILARQDAA